jgi:hypothetical protein
VFVCQAAPANSTEIGLLDNHAVSLRKPLKAKARSLSDNFTESFQPSVGKPMKLTKRSGVTPDYFRKHRKKAMKQIASSKYRFKYNFGGYIPYTLAKPKVKNIVNAEGFIII